ncbi:FG-GAP-like repeat-containing protein [Polymorphospora rubra]|uniref:FG-GAP-like repeat-containing protein n=1 Tax=Polymorphospora rubra TaxID=338584 RepID=UPI0033C54FDB
MTRTASRLPGLRHIVVALAAALTLSMFTTGAVDVADTARPAAANAGPVVDDYPYRGQSSGVDPWNYYKGQCTSFVAWRLNDRLGIDFTNRYKGQHFSNANTWDDAARRAGLTVSGTPRAGAVAQTDAGSFGHVAWVARVNSNGTVLIEEYNWATPSGYGTRTVPASSFRYIYFGNPPAPAPDRPAESVNGDRFEDLVAVDANDVMWMYPGRSAGTFGAAVRVGSGWIDNYNRVAVGDSNGDGFADLFATATDGVLWYWHNGGDGSFGSGTQVGQGWKAVQWFTVADVNGDDKADILAKVGDYLNLYVGTGRGQFAEPRRVGTGWSQVSRFAAGDADGDGDADIWGTKPDGTLLFWKGNGQGGFTAPAVVGGGWQGVREFAVLDVNGDGRADIVGVKTSDSTLIRWSGDGDGTFAAPVQIGHGWSTHRLASY